jgi:hypothetical protein
LTDRINQWRLDQSQLVFSELQRLERRLFSRTPSVLNDESDNGPNENESTWERVTRKVMKEWIGLSDEVLEVVCGERYVDAPPRQIYKHLGNLPPGWESAVVSRVFRELSIPRATNITLFRVLGERLLALTSKTNMTKFLYDDKSIVPQVYLARHYWEDSILSSNYWEQGSSVSTPVW